MKSFRHLSVMIDCARNAVPTVESWKKLFPMLAGMGYDRVLLYLEDVYEVEEEPCFGHKRGRYSLSELRELDDAADAAGIELIPCIQTLAHLLTIFRWPGVYRDAFDIDDVLLVDADRTYQLIDHMFSTLEKTFRSKTLHIGMDEAHHVGLGQYLDKHGFQPRSEILLRHLNRVCAMAKQHGFQCMMWIDMFFRLTCGGSYVVDYEVNFPPELIAQIPENLDLVYWDYTSENKDRYRRMIRNAQKLSPRISMAGGAQTWGGFAPHNRIAIPRSRASLVTSREAGIDEYIMTVWGDDGGECPPQSALPALMQAAADAEEIGDAEMKRRFREITGEDFDAMLDLDLPNQIYGEETYVGPAQYCKNRLYNDPFLRLMDNNHSAAVDPARFGQYAERLRQDAAKSPSFAPLFEASACLCDVLEIKFHLGTRTAALYAEKDLEGLRALAEQDYTEALARTERFHAAFRRQWEMLNKPYGFEVHDIRLGGLMQRLKTCRERLLDYCDGRVSRIEELEEPLLCNMGAPFSRYDQIVTANKFILS